MDSNPSYSLSFLYQNDPIYSLCASDLMTASQTVNNNFMKEQKELMKTLQKLEQQQLIRMRQLSEEQRTFAFVMNKRLCQRGSRPQTAPLHPSSSITNSAASIPPPIESSLSAPATIRNTMTQKTASRKCTNLRATGVKFEQPNANLLIWSGKQHRDIWKTQVKKNNDAWKELEPSAGLRCRECGHTRKEMARRQSCPAVLVQHHS